jgi:hypothetical protein
LENSDNYHSKEPIASGKKRDYSLSKLEADEEEKLTDTLK